MAARRVARAAHRRRELPRALERPARRPIRASALFTIADDIRRIRARVARLKDRNAHAEFPPSRTRRLITNVRITGRRGSTLRVEANFVVYRFRRDGDARQYVGRYRYTLVFKNGALKIKNREAILDSMELGALGTVSFIL